MKARFKMKIINILTISAILIGCGPSFTSGKEAIENTAGADNFGDAGINNEAGSMNNTAGSGSGGMENVAGKDSIGGNNSAGSNSAGAGGATCKPKVTCETYAISHSSSTPNTEKRVACGPLVDDCGNMIQCGGCPDYYGACGSPTDTYTYTYKTFTYNKDAITGTPNICGGGCFLYDEISPYGPGSQYYCYNSPITLNNQGVPVFDNTKPPPDPSCKNENPVPSPGGSQIASHVSFSCNSGLFNIGM